MVNSKTTLYCKKSLKQLYACNMESTKFINPQTFTSILCCACALQSWAFRFIKFVDSMVHAYNDYVYLVKPFHKFLKLFDSEVKRPCNI